VVKEVWFLLLEPITIHDVTGTPHLRTGRPIMAQTPQRVHFHGTGGTLFGIMLANILLSIVTLGIYSFWGRTRIRKYFWSSTQFDGDPFGYHGTGGELFKGYLMAMGALMGMAILLGLMTTLWEPTGTSGALMGIAFWLAIMAFVPFAIVSARRYRLSRTSWRNIRFALRADMFDFVKLWLWGAVLCVITLGVYMPFFQNRLRAFFTEHTHVGTEVFHYDGEGRDLFPKFLLGLLLTIPTLGLCWIWYKAERHRYYWEHTYFSEGRFLSSVSGGGLFELTITNYLLIVFTLGIATPWVLIRHFQFFAERLEFRGAIDYARIAQEAEGASAIGEGLADLFDAGGLDIGL
jgi:uncharacterized membrane protein YjgN (DUF898 family)